MRLVDPDAWLWIMSTAAAGAALSLWFGAARAPRSERAGYRWLALAAAAWCAGAAGQQLMSGQPNGFTAPLTLADLVPLLALAPMATGVIRLSPRAAQAVTRSHGQLLDGYVMASGLLVIGWLYLFGGEYHRSGGDPRTFLLGLVRPVTGMLAVGALLPFAAAGGRRLAAPYLGLTAIVVGDTFGAAVRLGGGHEPGGAEGAARIIGFLLLAAAPWVASRLAGRATGQVSGGTNPERRLPPTATISALTVTAAAGTLVTAELGGGSRVQPVVIIVMSSAVLALVARVLGSLRQNGLALAAAWLCAGQVRQFAERTSDAVLICDLDGTIAYASPSVAGYGYPAGAVLRRNLAEFVHPEDRSAATRRILRTIHGSGEDDGAGDRHASTADTRAAAGAAAADRETSDAAAAERVPLAGFPCRVLAADGTWRHVECTVSRYLQPSQGDQLLVTVRDMSDQIALRQQLAHVTFHDRLTGLPNRVYVEERVADILGRRRHGASAHDTCAAAGEGDELAAELPGLKVAAVFLQLDGFSGVKDSVGRAGADLLLTQVARRLRSALAPQHTLARWGGDEFAALVEARNGATEAVDVAERLARCIAAQPFRVSGRDITATASVGVAFAGDSPAGDVMRNADLAMTRAKACGGDRVELFAAHMHADIALSRGHGPFSECETKHALS